MLVALSLLMLIVAGVRNHEPAEVSLLAGLVVVTLIIGRWLGNDFRAHPSTFPMSTTTRVGVAWRGQAGDDQPLRH